MRKIFEDIEEAEKRYKQEIDRIENKEYKPFNNANIDPFALHEPTLDVKAHETMVAKRIYVDGILDFVLRECGEMVFSYRNLTGEHKLSIHNNLDIERVYYAWYLIDQKLPKMNFTELQIFEADEIKEGWLDKIPLQKIVIYETKIVKLPKLPETLIELNCAKNSIQEIPNLPKNLTILHCYRNNLTSLPKLPNSLVNLNCSINNITELPRLPSNLSSLDCSHNQLKKLPNVPLSLVRSKEETGRALRYFDNPGSNYIGMQLSGNKIYQKFRDFISK